MIVGVVGGVSDIERMGGGSVTEYVVVAVCRGMESD